VRKTISLALVPDARLGDYVIVHVGHALGRIDPDEAERTLALFGELAHAAGDGGGRAERRMKYIDEFRDGALAERISRASAEAQPGALPLHGVLRRPHARHLALRRGRPAARQRAHDPRPRLPGLRAAHRPHRPGDPAGAGARRHRLHLRRHMRVPASGGLSLMRAKARGGDIRMVYSPPTR
jgi:hydrogenase expression/formation protein HypC